MLKQAHERILKNPDIQKAYWSYLADNNIAFSGEVTFMPGIDHIAVEIGDDVVLRIGVPPTSNYEVERTEHTDKYLRK